MSFQMPSELVQGERMTLVEDIVKLKKEKNAIILAHNYQRSEVQEIADYVGDSVELSKKAIGERRAKIMVFSAVYFMAESVAIGKSVVF